MPANTAALPSVREILAKLIAFDTVSSNPNRALMDWVVGVLDGAGIDSLLVPDASGGKANLYATVGPKGAIRTMLLAAAKGVKVPLHLALSYDEEIGCMGVRSLIEVLEGAPDRPRFCIVGEPTGMQVATGHKGKVALRATCTGREGHSALAPMALNALHLAADFIGVIRAVQARVAAEGPFDGDYDVPYTTEAAIVVERQWDYPGLGTPTDAGVVNFVKSLTGANGTIKVAFGTEGGLFAARLGIPTVICGPGSMAQGHKPDEYVSLEQMDRCEAMLEALVGRLVSGF